MNVYLRFTSRYYSGFQKISMFSDPLFRQCLYILVVQCIIEGTIRCFPALAEFSGVLTSLFFLMPVVIHLAGGLPTAGWLWYGGFAVCAGVAMGATMVRESYLMLPLFFPAFYCLYRVLRSNTPVLEKLGYLGRESVVNEAFFGLFSGLLFAVLVYVTLARVRGMAFHVFGPHWYTFGARGR